MLMSGRLWVRNWFLRIGWLKRQKIRLRRRPNYYWSTSTPYAIAECASFRGECLEKRLMLSTITVTSLADTFNAGTGVTLRDAIYAANNNTSIDGSVAGEAGVQNIIGFQSGLTGTISLTQGQFTISSSMKIEGLGAANTIIDAQQNSRVFNITSTAGDVALDGLTLENGQVAAAGGAIYSTSMGTLTVTNSTLSANTVTDVGSGSSGGAIYSAGTTVTVTNSTLSGNLAKATAATDLHIDKGGAIFVSGAALSVSNSTLSGNSAPATGNGAGSLGGAIYTYNTTVTLASSMFSENSATSTSFSHSGMGGVIFVSGGALTVTDSILSGNSAAGSGGGGGFGGAINSNNAAVSITGSTLSANSATSLASAGWGYGGGVRTVGGTLTVTNSTFSGNSAAGIGRGYGGAIWTNSTAVTLTNSTLSANSARAVSFAAGVGGGLFVQGTSLSVTNSTLSGNSAGNRAGGVFAGGTIAALQNSIVAGNTDSGTAPDLLRSAGSLIVAGSLIGDNNGSGLAPAPIGVPDINGNLIGTHVSPIDPLLGPLANNGGPTQTMALLPGSPTINAGSNALAIDPIGVPLTNDQRGAGFSRIAGGWVDMGAFELQVMTPVVTSTTAPSVTYGQDGLVTVAVAPSNATGDLSLFVDGSLTAIGTHTLTQGDNGSFTFDVGILNAGTHSLHAVYTATGDFLSSTADGSLVVNKANATIDVTGYSATYDGAYHGATGSATGVGGADLSAQLNLGATFRNVPGGTAHWTFVGGTNYNDASGDVSIDISPLTVTGLVTANNKVYDGTTMATISSASLSGVVAGDDVSLTVGPANFASQNVGTWIVTAGGLSFSGNDAGNYALASTTAQTTASITARSLDAVLSTASTINIAKNGTITFTLSNLSGIVDGQTVAELFDGVRFSLMVGSTLYSGTATASVVNGTIQVSWRMDQELYTDLYALLSGATPSSKTTIDLKVFATSSDGNYSLSEDVLTKIFQQGNVKFS